MMTAYCHRGRLRVARQLRGTGGFGKRRELALRLAAGLNDAGGHDHRHRLLDRDIEIDHVAACGT